MRIFPFQPNISKAPDRYQKWYRPTLWELNDEYKITLLCGKQLVIHFGFRFSASIPWPFWIFLKPTGSLLIPGLIHDYLYKYNPFRTSDRKPWTRQHCDKTFWETAERKKHRLIMHWLAYAGVRLGGWKAWGEYRKNLKAALKDKCAGYLK